mmetsp:Transcript_104120/g.335612  ORF Transcript_104120/g.335612 Transcript_104120/m.335612 type:complete len:298 (-) Transcript_104120:1105-1998(-)
MPRQIGPDICSSVVGLPGTSRDFRDVSGTEELKTWRTGILFQATLAENRWASPPIVDGAPTPRCGGSAGLLPPNGGAMPEIDRHVMPSPMGLTRPFTLWSWAKTDSLLLGENFTVDPGPEVSSATMLVFVSRRACCSVNACEASNKKTLKDAGVFAHRTESVANHQEQTFYLAYHANGLCLNYNAQLGIWRMLWRLLVFSILLGGQLQVLRQRMHKFPFLVFPKGHEETLWAWLARLLQSQMPCERNSFAYTPGSTGRDGRSLLGRCVRSFTRLNPGDTKGTTLDKFHPPDTKGNWC